MRIQLLKKRQEGVSLTAAADGSEVSVQELVRQLIDGLPLSAVSESSGDKQRVILDVEMDDVRCLIIRLPTKSPRMEIILSPREHEIVRMVAEGYPNKTIAAVLDISSWTVGTYLRRIFAKLGVGSRAAMVARLLERGPIVEQLTDEKSEPQRPQERVLESFHPTSKTRKSLQKSKS